MQELNLRYNQKGKEQKMEIVTQKVSLKQGNSFISPDCWEVNIREADASPYLVHDDCKSMFLILHPAISY